MAGSPWRKLGRVILPGDAPTWCTPHAYCPTPVLLSPDTIRVYCAFVGPGGIGRLGFVDVGAENPTRVAAVSTHPCLDLGAPGRFDEHGITPVSIVRNPRDGHLMLYYAGWQRGVGVRYFLFAGLATSEDGVSFTRVSECPILERCVGESLIRTSPMVRTDGDGFRMWYSAGNEWSAGSDGVSRPRYSLREAYSDDGYRWTTPGVPCSLDTGDATAVGRACVRPLPSGEWEMWFSYREDGGAYRMGHAQSPNGIEWIRGGDACVIRPGPPGDWDSDSVGLGTVLETSAGVYMFYNGNGIGTTGFGVARLDRDDD